MKTDIELIAEAFQKLGKAFTVTRLQVKHPGVDDDGLWFFRKMGSDLELQLESSSGQCPFLIESNRNEKRFTAQTVEEARRLLFEAFN